MVEPIYGEKPLGAGIIWPASGRNKDLLSVTGATAFQAVVFTSGFSAIESDSKKRCWPRLSGTGRTDSARVGFPVEWENRLFQ
jgi:hypothetical protein